MAAAEFLTAEEARAIIREELERVLAQLRPDEMLSPEEFKERSGISLATIYRHLRSGKLPSTRVGAQYRIPASALQPEDQSKVVELAHAARFGRRT